ncbi:MAG TPA: formate dehydrogenase accessory sulfurtransferase FdhD [Candidatus Evtepia faecigallinarum]|nr:formate dehydrogenase accessory sulfurtransferase FdhD [Candidatus Evtepia faecigallinarum]
MEKLTEDRAASRRILAYEKGAFQPQSRDLVKETNWRLIVNGEEADTFACSPWELEEVALGILFFRGTICRAEEVAQLRVLPAEGRMEAVLRPLSPPVREEGEPLLLRASQVLTLAAGLEAGAGLFRRTGGVHTAALARQETILLRREDVSRHGALEKLAGACLREKFPMAGTILVFSGRVSHEIVSMAGRMGCGAIIARSAPTDLACQAAEEREMVLIGFAREESFNLYTCPHWVVP